MTTTKMRTTEMKANDIIKQLEQVNNKPLDYIHFLMYDKGTQSEPYETWIDVDCEIDEPDVLVPEPLQDLADLLFDLRDGYTIIGLEYLEEPIDDKDSFCLRVRVCMTEDGEETNITDEVADAFYTVML